MKHKKLTQKDIYSIDQIKKYAKTYFFHSVTTEIFKSHISKTIYNGTSAVYFVTSEKFDDRPRLYTVRKLNLNTRKIETVGLFNYYLRSIAHQKAKELAKNEVENQLKRNI